MPSQITLPAVLWSECNFKAVRQRDTDRMENRRTESMTSGTAYWTARYKTERLTYRKMGLLDAFALNAGEDNETFLGYDVFRPRPIKMDQGVPLAGTRAGGGTFDGTATLTTISSSRSVIVSTLPAGFIFYAGDYVEFRMSTLLRSLHIITADATANGSGVVTLPIKYGLDTDNFTTSAVVNFEKPSCVMQIDPGSYDATKSWASRQPTFSATEMFFGS